MSNLTRRARRINHADPAKRYAQVVRILVLSLTAFALAAPAVGATGESGLRGVVMRGPTSPVCRVDQRCEAPAANVVIVFSQAGHVVARTTTGPKGGYRIGLRPGRYVVATAKRAIGVGLTPRAVVVPRAFFARVDLHLDTGIQ